MKDATEGSKRAERKPYPNPNEPVREPDLAAILNEDYAKIDSAALASAGIKRDAAAFYGQHLRGRVEAARSPFTFGDSNRGVVEVTIELIPSSFIRRRVFANGRHFADVWVNEITSGLEVGCENFQTHDGTMSRIFV